MCIEMISEAMQSEPAYIPPLDDYSDEDLLAAGTEINKSGGDERIMRCLIKAGVASQKVVQAECERLRCGQFHPDGCPSFVIEHFNPGIGSLKVYEDAIANCDT